MKPFKVCAGTLLVRTSPEDDATLIQQVQWLNDPEVVKYSEQRHHIHTLESQRLYYKSFAGSNLFLAIYIGDEMIGTMTVYTDDYNGIANVGILIGDKTKWGLGYGLEAWRAVCNRLLATGTRKIVAGCMEINQPMMSICSRYGMLQEAKLPDHFIYDIKHSPVAIIHWGKFK